MNRLKERMMQQLNSIQKSEGGSMQDTSKFGESGALGGPLQRKEVWDNFSFASRESTIHENHPTGHYQDSLFFSENVMKQRLGLVDPEGSGSKAEAGLYFQSEKKPDPFNPSGQLFESIVEEKEESPKISPDKRLKSKQILEDFWKKQRNMKATSNPSNSHSGKKKSSKGSVAEHSTPPKNSNQASPHSGTKLSDSKETKKSAALTPKPSADGRRSGREIALENVRKSLASVRTPTDPPPHLPVPPLRLANPRIDRVDEQPPSERSLPRPANQPRERQASTSPAYQSSRVLRNQDLNVSAHTAAPGASDSRKLTNIYKELDRQKRATTESYKRLSEKYELMLKDYQPWDEGKAKNYNQEIFREVASIADRFSESTDSSRPSPGMAGLLNKFRLKKKALDELAKKLLLESNGNENGSRLSPRVQSRPTAAERRRPRSRFLRDRHPSAAEDRRQ